MAKQSQIEDILNYRFPNRWDDPKGCDPRQDIIDAFGLIVDEEGKVIGHKPKIVERQDNQVWIYDEMKRQEAEALALASGLPYHKILNLLLGPVSGVSMEDVLLQYWRGFHRWPKARDHQKTH